MRVDSNDLVNTAEIAKRTGFTDQAVSNWTKRYKDFPPVVQEIGRIKLRSWKAVEKWLMKTNRL